MPEEEKKSAVEVEEPEEKTLAEEVEDAIEELDLSPNQQIATLLAALEEADEDDEEDDE